MSDIRAVILAFVGLAAVGIVAGTVYSIMAPENGLSACRIACGGHVLRWTQRVISMSKEDTPEKCECQPEAGASVEARP